MTGRAVHQFNILSSVHLFSLVYHGSHSFLPFPVCNRHLPTRFAVAVNHSRRTFDCLSLLESLLHPTS